MKHKSQSMNDILFMQGLAYNWSMAQSVLKVRFVPDLRNPKTELLTMPKGLRTPHLYFKDSCLTNFGCMILFQRFLQQAQTALDDSEIFKILQRNAEYLPSNLILALLYAIMAGLRKINKT